MYFCYFSIKQTTIYVQTGRKNILTYINIQFFNKYVGIKGTVGNLDVDAHLEVSDSGLFIYSKRTLPERALIQIWTRFRRPIRTEKRGSEVFIARPFLRAHQSGRAQTGRAASGSMVWVNDGVWWESADQSERTFQYVPRACANPRDPGACLQHPVAGYSNLS